MPTIKNVAELAGVSVATVSRFINESGYVSEASREKISAAIKELNYTPNEVARSLFKKTSKLIGLLIPQIDNPYFSTLIKGVESECNERGYHLIISNVENPADEKRYIEAFMKNNIAGVVSAIGSDKNVYENLRCPIIGVDRAVNMTEYSVCFDEVQGGKLCAEAILKGKPEKVLVNSGPKELEVAKLRLNGIKQVLEERNIDYDVYYSKDYGYNSGVEFSSFLEDNISKYDSIIACNDLHALFAAKIISKGYNLPEDIQLIGYDDTIFSKLFSPNIATISHDGCLLGKKAAQMLLSIINKENIDNKVIELDCKLMENDTLRK